MPLSKVRLFVILSCFSTPVQSQQRIGVDVSTQMNNLNLTANYYTTLKGQLLFSAGAFYGGMGHRRINNDDDLLNAGYSIKSPYQRVNVPISDSLTTYHLIDYRTSGKALGIQGGFAYYFEFGTRHGLRTSLYAKLAYAKTKITGYYHSLETDNEVIQGSVAYHYYGGISAEIAHTIRLSGRITFYYGFKFPYYFTVDKARFNPLTHKDLFSGIEPELSLGFTRVIGKCN